MQSLEGLGKNFGLYPNSKGMTLQFSAEKCALLGLFQSLHENKLQGCKYRSGEVGGSWRKCRWESREMRRRKTRLADKLDNKRQKTEGN